MANIVLSKEELEKMVMDAAMVAANMAVENLQQTQTKEARKTRDRRLHNTKLLLRNYITLKEHVSESICSNLSRKENPEELLKELMETGGSDEVVVESIKRSKERSAIIVSHIDKMLSVYKSFCKESSKREQRQYEIVKDYYLAKKKKTVAELSKKYGVSKVTIYDDLKIAEERLTTLLFGIDGLKIF